MKRGVKILSFVLVMVTLLSVFAAIPVSAAGYSMSCSIYYKDTSGNTLAATKTFSVNAADSTATANAKYTSPTISGYSLQNSSDSVVTYAMMDKSFPASHYVRNGSATYTVYYVKNESTIIYYKYGGSGDRAAAPKTMTGKPGASFSVASPTITGYTPSKATVTGTYGSSSQTVYYYEKTYTVSYNANGGSGAPSSQTKKYFTDLTLSSTSPYRTGYTFKGWSTSSSATSALYQPGGTYSSNMSRTLYAVWAVNKYTVSYNANGGSGAPASQTKVYGLDMTLSSAVPTRSGYTFLGWGTYSSDTTVDYSPGGTYSSNYGRTLYAIWESNTPSSYTVSYNANGGSGAPASQTKYHDVDLTLSSTVPTRSGYSFLGWSSSSSASSATYSAGGTYTANASVTLYAVWSCSHSSTTQSYVSGCDWERVCDNCGITVSTGTTHGPYTYGDWTYYSSTRHRRTKVCYYGDYSGYEYGNHGTSTEYEQYNATQHKYYSYCTDCSSVIGSTYYEDHNFTSTTSGGKTVYTCTECGYTKSTTQTYTVSYNANGGSNAPASQIKTHGVTLILSSVKPTRAGYSFLGWSTSSSATTVGYSAGGNYTNNASVTLYAVWSCSHSSSTTNWVTGCDWESICDSCGAVLSSGTTHGPFNYGVWTYYSSTQHVREKNCNHGDYTVKEYGSHTTETRFEQYSSTQHKYYSYCTDCNTMIGSASYESHSFTSSKSDGKITYTCTSCGYSYYVMVTYTVTYNANGGTEAPASQTKTHGTNLQLSIDKPIREGYDFLGWARSSSASSPDYYSGGTYTDNASLTLYAVWKRSVYTVTYNANGGTGAPGEQTKTYGQTLTLSSVVPTRNNHAFMGWSTTSGSTTVQYYGGESYSDNASITLYAVWIERNYDFSVSGLTVTPEEVYQYEKVTVKFRLDSWDKNLPYDNIPVDVLLNGVVIYSTTVDFAAYGVQNVNFDINVGSSLGNQTIEARVNWSDHQNETRTGNNTVSTTYSVKKVIETTTSPISASGEYYEGMDVVTSFYAVSEGSSDIIPSDGVDFNFYVYYIDNGRTVTVDQQTWSSIVIPANGKNLVYFKWSIPEGCAGKTFFCKGTVNASKADKEQNQSNNSVEFSVLIQSLGSSQTENTRYEDKAPAGYTSAANPPTERTGSATWNMWVYEGGKLVLKHYGIAISNEAPLAEPGSGCVTAIKTSGSWKMRSGYGITLSWNPGMVAKSGYTMPGSNAYTLPQVVYATLPEYSYSITDGRFRTLESVGGIFRFYENADADKNERVHFIPVYVNDGAYTVSVTATQIWTPAGMLYAVRNANTITIDGTIYDDWYQG